MTESNKEEKMIKTLSRCSNFGDPAVHYKKLVQLQKSTESNEEYLFLLKIMNALGSKDRLIIVDILREKDRCVCEIEIILDKSQGAVSHQLKILEEAKLIQGWKQGKYTHYSLLKPTFEKFLELISKWAGKTTNWFGAVPAVSET